MTRAVPIILREEVDGDRPTIHRIRHEVYAEELGQRPINAARSLVDEIDEINRYLVATRADEIVGFIAVTPPGHGRYSFDRYFKRDELPFEVDNGLFESRLITIARQHRVVGLAHMLIYASLRWSMERGATRMVSSGHARVRTLYESLGLRFHELRVEVGRLTYHLCSGSIEELATRASAFELALRKFSQSIPLEWCLSASFEQPSHQ